MTFDCLHNCARYAKPCDTCLDPALCETRPELVGVIKTLPGIVHGPYVKWYRHPIWWWRMRHLRHDIKVMTEAVDPEFKQKFDEELDRVFLFGNGGE